MSAATCAASCQFVIPVQVQTYSQPNLTTDRHAEWRFTRNPFIDDFMTRTGRTAAPLPATGALYTAANWRPFGYGGNPAFEDGFRQTRQQRERFLITTGITGEFTGETMLGQLLNGIKYDYSAQFNQYLDTGISPDVSVARLQTALMGYGGFNCPDGRLVPTDYSSGSPSTARSASRATLGPAPTAASGSTRSPAPGRPASATGARQPDVQLGQSDVPVASSTARPTGYANPVDLVDWMTVDRLFETQYQSSHLRLHLVGRDCPSFDLPGGPSAGRPATQWRMTERRSISATGNRRTSEPSTCSSARSRIRRHQSAGPAEPGIPSAAAPARPGAFFGADEHTESDEDSQTRSY